MDWLQVVLQWLHVLLGIFWFGNALAANGIVIPAMLKLPLDRQREFGGHYAAQARRVLGVVAPLVIVLGVVRGTVMGPIKSLDALATPYGITWLVALLAAIGTYLWAKRAIEPAADRLDAIPLAEAFDTEGRPSPRMLAALAELKRAGMLELIGFLVVFTCMILMRFGL